MHVYGYWQRVLEDCEYYLDLRIALEDALAQVLHVDHYSDADDASQFNRKSVGGAALIVQSPSGASRALLDCGCKQQPSAAKSSGESEIKTMHDVVQDIAGIDHPTDEERELIQKSADKTKAAGIVMTRIAYPVEELLRWLAHERINFHFGRLFPDASVAVSVDINGESRVMAYLRKTQAVDLAWMRDTMRLLGIVPTKIETERNIADLWTKAVSASVFRVLLPL